MEHSSDNSTSASSMRRPSTMSRTIDATHSARPHRGEMAIDPTSGAIETVPPSLSIAQEIAALKASLPAGYAYPAVTRPGKKQSHVGYLPDMDPISLNAILALFKEPSALIKRGVLEFLRSGGVLPQVFMWHEQLARDSGRLLDQLAQKLPLSEWNITNAQNLARNIARLAGLPRAAMMSEPCEAIRLCIDYTKSLRSKNVAEGTFFRMHYISDETNLLICSTVLIAAYKDYHTLPGKGFFATLFGSRLKSPMSAELRKLWERGYQIHHEPATKSRSGESSLEIRMEITPVMWVNEETMCSDEVTQEMRVHEQAANKMRLQELSEAKPLNENAENESRYPVPNLQGHELELNKERSLQRRLLLSQQKLERNSPDVEENPFTDNERLLYLEAFMKQSEIETKKRAQHEETPFVDALFSFIPIAEILPRRSRTECIQHHAIMSKLLRAQNIASQGTKRPAEEIPALEKKGKKKKTEKTSSTEILSAEASTPTTANDDTAVPPALVPKRHRNKGFGKDMLAHADELEEMKADYKQQMTKKDEELKRERAKCAELQATQDSAEAEQRHEERYRRQQAEHAEDLQRAESQTYSMLSQLSENQIVIADHDAARDHARAESDHLFGELQRSIEKASSAKDAADTTAKELRRQLRIANDRADIARENLDSANTQTEHFKRQAHGKDQMELDLASLKEAMVSAEQVKKEALEQQGELFGAAMRRRDRRITQLVDELERNELPVPQVPTPQSPSTQR